MRAGRIGGFLFACAAALFALYFLMGELGLKLVEGAYGCVKIGDSYSDYGHCISRLHREEIEWGSVEAPFRVASDAPDGAGETVIRYSVFGLLSFVIVTDKDGRVSRKIPIFE